MQKTLMSAHKANISKIYLLIGLCILLGAFPALTAITSAKLIDQKTTYQYSFYCGLILSQTACFRLKEFLLQQIQVTTFPKLQAKLKRKFNNHDLAIQDNICKIARFASNLWPICQMLRSLVLIISTTLIIYLENDNINSWLIFMAIASAITIGWQPNTKKIIRRKQHLSNKLAACIKPNNKRLAQACVTANTITNLIIYKQQAIKTIIISSLILVIAYQNWQLYLIHGDTFGKTLMLLNISISQTEILWWLQHELSQIRTEFQSFNSTKETLINTYAKANQV